jgi:DNA-binding response OmpR family regulator
MRALIIEDDITIAGNLYDYLASRGFTVDVAHDGLLGMKLASEQQWDIILLDLSLPRLDGLTLCERLRTSMLCDAPILMLTARDTEESMLAGFSAGADDYVVKPFSLKEIAARVDALIKRARRSNTSGTLRIDDLSLNLATLHVQRGEHTLRLPPKGLQLLSAMMRQPARVFPRSELETLLWGENVPDSDALRSHIHMLRRALNAHGGAPLIDTVHGIGYRLCPQG